MVPKVGFVLPAVVCLVLVGCGDGITDKPTTGLVKGIVMLDGTPVTGAMVEFNPDNSRSTDGPKSSGRTDESGKFELFGPGNLPGAVIGFHKVTIACPPPPGQTSSADGKAQAAGPPCLVPVKFGRLDTTDVSKEVMPGKNEFTIELKSE